MNLAPELIRRTKIRWDTEDLATSFMEEEVGRHDWVNNWRALKQKGDLRLRVQTWLEALNIDHDPDAIVAYVDRMVEERSGRWL